MNKISVSIELIVELFLDYLEELYILALHCLLEHLRQSVLLVLQLDPLFLELCLVTLDLLVLFLLPQANDLIEPFQFVNSDLFLDNHLPVVLDLLFGLIVTVGLACLDLAFLLQDLLYD